MKPPNFFSELKRRNVYKVAVAYVIVGWLLVQVATQVFPFFEIPNWGIRLIVLLIVIGFPIALILAWAFELTPEGIKRAEDVAPNESTTGRAGGKLDFIINAKSIAVLPFENRSANQENAFFTDGVQDEILTDLAKIADLKVISRRSVMAYKSGSQRNLRRIAQELGVAHILEGSVQRASDSCARNSAKTVKPPQLLRRASYEPLGKIRILTGSDPYVLESRANEMRRMWNEQHAKKLERDLICWI